MIILGAGFMSSYSYFTKHRNMREEHARFEKLRHEVQLMADEKKKRKRQEAVVKFDSFISAAKAKFTLKDFNNTYQLITECLKLNKQFQLEKDLDERAKTIYIESGAIVARKLLQQRKFDEALIVSDGLLALSENNTEVVVIQKKAALEIGKEKQRREALAAQESNRLKVEESKRTHALFEFKSRVTDMAERRMKDRGFNYMTDFDHISRHESVFQNELKTSTHWVKGMLEDKYGEKYIGKFDSKEIERIVESFLRTKVYEKTH